MKPRDPSETALSWYASLPPPTTRASLGEGGDVRRYVDTSPEMSQPALSDNLLCMHLGGPKEVRRWHEGRQDVHSVALGALTVMPADQANRWETRGPIDFAHISLSPRLVSQIAQQEFGRDSSGLHLIDRVGFHDPYVETLFVELLAGVQEGWPGGRLYAESLLTVLTYRLVKRYSTLSPRSSVSQARLGGTQGGLAPWRLRRVVDYMQAHLHDDVALVELTELSGLSRAHFFRAFRRTTGQSPHQYLDVLRLEHGRTLLHLPDAQVEAVSRSVGFSSADRFTALFRRRFGLTPRTYLSGLH